MCVSPTPFWTQQPLHGLWNVPSSFLPLACMRLLLLLETNYHKPSGLKQHKFIFLGFCRSESHMGLKSTCQQECIPFWGWAVWGENLFP